MNLRSVLDRLTAALGLAVFAVAFWPWWSVQVRSSSWEDGRETNVAVTTHTRTAWQVSTRWTIAVVLVATVTTMWLILLLRDREIPLIGRILAVGALGVAIGLTITQWRDVEHWPLPNSVQRVEISVGPGVEHRDVEQELVNTWAERDHLRSIHEDGLTADVSAGMWAGLATMALTALALLAAMIGGFRHHDDQ